MVDLEEKILYIDDGIEPHIARLIQVPVLNVAASCRELAKDG